MAAAEVEVRDGEPSELLGSLVRQILALLPELGPEQLLSAAAEIVRSTCATGFEMDTSSLLHLMRRAWYSLATPGGWVKLAGLRDGFEGRVGIIVAHNEDLVRVALPSVVSTTLNVSVWNLLPAPMVPELEDDLWRHIWTFTPTWTRIEVFAAVCKRWRSAAFADPALWGRVVVVGDKAFREGFADEDHCGRPKQASWDRLERGCAAVSCGSVGAVVNTWRGQSAAMPYLVDGYLPLLPDQLAQIPDRSWVRTLVVVEPTYPSEDDETSKDTRRKHSRRYWAVMHAVCGVAFPRLEALRLSVEGLEALPFSELRVRFYPWLRALPPTLLYLALDASEGGESVMEDFRKWNDGFYGNARGKYTAVRPRPEAYLDWLPNLRGLRHPDIKSGHLSAWSAERRGRLETLETGNPGCYLSSWSAAEVCEICRLLPSLRALYWPWPFSGPRDLEKVITSLPPTLEYLSVDITRVGFDGPDAMPWDDWAAFARPAALRRLIVTVEPSPQHVPPHPLFLPGHGPLVLSTQLSRLMPEAAVLVVPIDDDEDWSDDEAAGPQQQSVLHGVFFSSIEQQWLRHARRCSMPSADEHA